MFPIIPLVTANVVVVTLPVVTLAADTSVSPLTLPPVICALAVLKLL